MTPELKAKVFGLSAAAAYGVDLKHLRRKTYRDRIDDVRSAYRQEPEPSLTTYGPRTSQDFLALQDEQGGLPV